VATVKTSPALCRNEFTTDDLAEAREFLDQAYSSRLLAVGVPAGSPFLAASHIGTGLFAVGDLAMPAALTFALDPSDQVIISTVVQGTVQVERGQDIDRYQAGDVLLGSVRHTGPTVRTHGLRNSNVVLPLSLLHAVAGTEAGTSAPFRFLSHHLASPAARAQWSDVTRYVGDLLGRPDALLSPLVVTSAARLLAATALTVFPSTAPESSPRDRRDASSATVRRATAFIDEQAGQDITVSGIAAAACVTVRSLQLAFRRELDTTPMAYLRTVRLTRAHRELLDASRGQETVTAVAYRWGFSSASRFTAFYRETYGVSPKQTLERG
jgi:AraC-like DNA-binding protein